MDLLKAEIERKKRAAEAAKKSAASSGAAGTAVGSSARYMKASERRRLQEEKEAEEERRRREEAESHKRSSKNKKRRRDGEGDGIDAGADADKGDASTTNKAGGKPDISKSSTSGSGVSGDNQKKAKSTSNDGSKDTGGSKRQKHDKLREELNDLAPADVAARLRSLGLPVRLFGERTAERIDRLYDALERQRREMAGLSEMDEFRLGSGHGIRNPFLDRRGGADGVGVGAAAAGAAATDKSLSTGVKKSGGGDDSAGGKKGKDDNGDKSRKDGDEGDDDDPHKKIHKFFKSLLKQWEDDLAHRPDSVKQTAAKYDLTFDHVLAKLTRLLLTPSFAWHPTLRPIVPLLPSF